MNGSYEMTMPNFLIIGAAKSGTTSLYHYLKAHPQIYMSPIKETDFFAWPGENADSWRGPGNPPDPKRFEITTEEAYQALFQNVTNERAIGEASPLYLESPIAAKRIHDRIPNAKVIAILRNPADRAFSDYLDHVRHAKETPKIEQAFQDDAHYIQIGFYYPCLKQYFDIFNRNQISVYLFEDFKTDPIEILQHIFQFLGVDATFVPDVSVRHNAGSFPKNTAINALLRNPTINSVLKPILPKRIRQLAATIWRRSLTKPPQFPHALRNRLLQLYREDTLKLQELLQRDLSNWLG